MIDIPGRQIEMKPYGLAFLKTRLIQKNVAPVMYLNNDQGGIEPLLQALFSLVDTHLGPAELLLPLISTFGRHVRPPGAAARPGGTHDFLWEREWRFPSVRGPLKFDVDDVFVGLCPDGDIAEFEAAYAIFGNLKFVDPTRNIKYYAHKLVDQRHAKHLRYSVV